MPATAESLVERKASARLWRVLVALVAPSILILVIFNMAGLFIGLRTAGDAQAIQDGIRRNYPYILMANHTLLFLLLMRFMRKDGLSLADIGWKLQGGSHALLPEVLMGGGAGVALHLADRNILSKAVNGVWWLLGSTREPATTDVTEGSSRMAWVIAGTLFAGVIEESLYRGYALTQLRQRLTIWRALLMSALGFGLLHLGLGGPRYVLQTALWGVLISGLFLWRRSLIAPAVGHAVTNVVALLRYWY